MGRRTCVNCMIPLYPEKNGAFQIEMAGTPPRPYRIRHCDIWACKRCGMAVTVGFPEGGTEEWMDSFADLLEKIRSDPTARIVYQYERLSDAARYGDSPPDVEIGPPTHANVRIVTLDEVEGMIDDSPFPRISPDASD